MPVINFQISEDKLKVLSGIKAISVDFFNNLFFAEPENNKEAIEQIRTGLLAFHQQDGGSPEIHSFKITDSSFNPQTNSGKIKFGYEVFFTFGCADIHRSDICTETCTFKIEQEKHLLIIHLTDQITRDTVDEF